MKIRSSVSLTLECSNSVPAYVLRIDKNKEGGGEKGYCGCFW